jgi:hypothetical protein
MSQSNVLVGKTAVFQHVRLKAASPLTTPFRKRCRAPAQAGAQF